jgi:UDP-N-acetylmuramoyl-tripeptide--D-alanyl-D-alanine ligase
MEVVHSSGGLTILNDSYNANPASTAAAVEALTALPASGLRWAVLGHMAELGGFHDGEHRRIGGLVAEVGVDRLVVVGDDAAPFAEGAAAAGVRVDAVATPEDALDLLRRCLRPGDAVLVKASRVVGLERVVEGLLDVPHRALPTLTDADARPDVASPDISGPDVADPGRAGRERG